MSRLNIVLASFLALAVIAGIILLLSNRGLRHDLGTTKRDLNKSNKQLDISRDSVHILEERTEELTLVMGNKVTDLRDSLKQKSNESARWQNNYVKEKKFRLDRAMPNPALDSLVTGFLEGH